jgi:glyoxylase-like metal-dependent hydrolase (beta-lactamase superfamily II)
LDVLETPGFTRGSVSYVAKLEDQTIVFTGDLIAGPGKLLDIYSFQDAVEEANIRGYHGYGGRFAALLASIEKVKALKPDVLVPARGEIIRRPLPALDKLSQRVKELYRSYLSTSALNWYFKEDRMGQCAERILGPQAKISLMPYSAYEDTPDWIWVKGTSRLIISETGHSLLIDCGNAGVIEGVKELLEAGVINKVDGIFVTHYHDDHTDSVQMASEEFDCPVYAVQSYVDILQHPGNYHMPCLHHTPIEKVMAKQHGDIMEFHEFKLTFRVFPGQTFYHGALLVEPPNKTPVFFVGDAFSPSGMDDYCVLNRNLMHKDDGFLYCFEQIRALGENYWLINEHIPHVFRFSEKELETLETQFLKRIDTVRSLTVWEQWAVLYPYGLQVKPRGTHEFNVVITNHSSKRRDYDVQFRLPEGAELISVTPAAKVPAGGLVFVRAMIRLPEQSGHYLIRADVKSDGIDVRDWVESTVIVVADEK